VCDSPEISVDCCTRPRRFARRVGRSWGRISVAQARRDLSTRAPAASGGPLGGAAPCIEAHTVRKIGRRASDNLPEEKVDTPRGLSTLDRLLHGAALRVCARAGSRRAACPAFKNLRIGGSDELERETMSLHSPFMYSISRHSSFSFSESTQARERDSSREAAHHTVSLDTRALAGAHTFCRDPGSSGERSLWPGGIQRCE